MKGCKSSLGNKEEKVMFLVVSRSNVLFAFEHPLRARSGPQVKLRARKIGLLKRDLATPAIAVYIITVKELKLKHLYSFS